MLIPLKTDRKTHRTGVFSRAGMLLFLAVFTFMGVHMAEPQSAQPNNRVLDVVFKYDDGGDGSEKKPQYSVYITARQDVEGIVSLESNVRADPDTWSVLLSSPSNIVFRKDIASILYYEKDLPEDEYYRIRIKPHNSASYYSDVFKKQGTDFVVIDWKQVQNDERKYLYIGLTIIMIVILMVILIGLFIQQKFNVRP